MHEFIRALQGGRKVILRESPRPITPFGGLAVCLEFLRGLGLADQVQQHLPFTWRSPNAIPPVTTFTAFLLAVVVGAQRFAQTQRLRADHALHALAGYTRFPGDDTLRHVFRRFKQGQVHALFDALTRWQVFVCGAALGRSGHHLVLFLSQSWGGLTQRKPSGQIATKPGPNCAEVDAHPNRNRDLNPQPTLKSSANFGFQEAGTRGGVF